MKGIFAIAALVLGMAVPPAQAAVLDFVGLAAGNEGNIEGNSYNFGGLNVTITSSNFAYLDDLSGGKPGGLGVCESDAGCAGNADDNVGPGEWLTLTFDRLVVLSGFHFNDGDHNSLSSSLKTIQDTAPGFGIQTLSFADFSDPGTTSVLLKSLTFIYGGPNPDLFYVASMTATASTVPVPAGAPLLLAGLAAFGLMGWRKRKAMTF